MEPVATPRTHQLVLVTVRICFLSKQRAQVVYPHYMFLHIHLDMHGQIYAESEPLDVHLEFAFLLTA